jgi:hypothetical protein
MRDGHAGRLLVTCWAGCDRRDVIAELRRLGLLVGRVSDHPGHAIVHLLRDDVARDAARTPRALEIWREARPIASTLAQQYLIARCIEEPLAAARSSLRYHPSCPHPRGIQMPAMVALVERAERGRVAVHRTYLTADHRRHDRTSLGPIGGGAVRLGLPRTGEWIAIAEGIETALAAATACAIPAWAALSAGGLRAGRRAGEDARARWPRRVWGGGRDIALQTSFLTLEKDSKS